MKRDWLTLTFGIVLVAGVVGLSVWQNAAGTGWRPGHGGETSAQAAESGSNGGGTGRNAPAARSEAVADARVVRLDVAVPVVHKHRFGSCEGTLRAQGDRLVYATTHQEDAFRVAFREVEQFDIDVEKDNLRVRRRGGRTWNFTPRGQNSAALVAFHREVSRSRTRTGAR